MPTSFSIRLYDALRAIFSRHNKIALRGLANELIRYLTLEELTIVTDTLEKSVAWHARMQEGITDEQED